jgi:hypothetical protein
LNLSLHLSRKRSHIQRHHKVHVTGRVPPTLHQGERRVREQPHTQGGSPGQGMRGACARQTTPRCRIYQCIVTSHTQKATGHSSYSGKASHIERHARFMKLGGVGVGGKRTSNAASRAAACSSAASYSRRVSRSGNAGRVRQTVYSGYCRIPIWLMVNCDMSCPSFRKKIRCRRVIVTQNASSSRTHGPKARIASFLAVSSCDRVIKLFACEAISAWP